MKVILVTPYYHQPRGNTITVQRISAGLARLGIDTEIVSITEEQDFPPLPSGDIVHGFNAYQFYRYWEQRGSSSYPYLVTLTGTDLNHSLFQEQARETVTRSLSNAKAVHVFNEEARDKLWHELPGMNGKTFIIPQGVVTFPQTEGKAVKEKDTFLFLLPAGIRRVKNITSAISMLSSLYREDPRIRLWIVGPVIEQEEAAKIRKLVGQQANWISYLGQVPHQVMGELFRCADVVLNTSFSEGQSSAVLEAMALGIPVVVADNDGNRSIVTHGEAGFLYNNEQDFMHHVRRLLGDRDLRMHMGAMGKRFVKDHHSCEKEAENLAAVYRHILQHGE